MIGISDLVKNPDETDTVFTPCGEFQSSPKSVLSQIQSPPHWCPWDIFRSFDVCSDAKKREREWGAESNRKLPHLFIPSKTVTLVPEFAVKDLP